MASDIVEDHSDRDESCCCHNIGYSVVVHACHGHRYWPLSVPLSGTGKKRGGGGNKEYINDPCC